MKPILFVVVLTLYTVTSDSPVHNENKGNILSAFKRSNYGKKTGLNIKLRNDKKATKKMNLYEKAMLLKEKSKREYEENNRKKQDVREMPQIEYGGAFNKKKFEKEQYRLDPILNFLKRKNFRRVIESSTEDSSSSSQEVEFWKDEWKTYWMKKKFEAINSTEPQGDVLNMVAARPWGVPCGDPNQHDMPWGSCLLPMECEAEYRIYRGDYFCGRTQFVCCALQLTNYDMYQGFDVSFDNSDLTTDSEDKRNKGKGSREKRKRKRRREKKRRRRDRKRRKQKMRRNIRKIVSEIRKILNRVYRNGTRTRKKKTKQLKKFIKELKKKYRKDRQSVKDIHESAIIQIDERVKTKLKKIKDMNVNFMRNSTFRDIVVNGTTDKKGARMLVQAYPDLAEYFGDKTRRSNIRRRRKNGDYDVEYGILNY